MRSQDAGGEEEGLLGFGEEVELLEGFSDGDAIRINFVVPFFRLKDIHVLGTLPDFAVGESVHPASRVLPFSGREKVAVPGLGHFGFRVVIPVLAPTSAGMMAHFTNGHRV